MWYITEKEHPSCNSNPFLATQRCGDVWRGHWLHTSIRPVAMRGEPSAKANQSPTHGFNDGPAAQVSNLVQNINFAVLGLDNGVWFSLPNPINFLSFRRLNQKEIHEYLRPSSQDQYDFSDGFHTVLTFRLCFKLNWGGFNPQSSKRRLQTLHLEAKNESIKKCVKLLRKRTEEHSITSAARLQIFLQFGWRVF